jgi:DNA-binding transcriptional LysR family regulator
MGRRHDIPHAIDALTSQDEDALHVPSAGTVRIAVAPQLGRIASRQRFLAEAVAHPDLRLRFLASAERLEALARSSAQAARSGKPAD